MQTASSMQYVSWQCILNLQPYNILHAQPLFSRNFTMINAYSIWYTTLQHIALFSQNYHANSIVNVSADSVSSTYNILHPPSLFSQNFTIMQTVLSMCQCIFNMHSMHVYVYCSPQVKERNVQDVFPADFLFLRQLFSAILLWKELIIFSSFPCFIHFNQSI